MVSGAVVVGMGTANGNPITTAGWLMALAGLGWWVWPGRKGSHISHSEAQRQAGDDDVIVYWRPG